MTAKTTTLSHAEASQALVLACRDMLNDQAGRLTADAVTEAVHVAVAEFGDASPAAVRWIDLLSVQVSRRPERGASQRSGCGDCERQSGHRRGRRMSKARGLTARQAVFVAEYLVCLNASEAARRAGYSAKSAMWIGAQLLVKTHIAAAIEEQQRGQAGCMLVFHGSAAGMSATPATVFAHAQANAFYGRSVSCAGDVNADGYADVLIGATTFTNGQTSEGAGYLHLGSPSGIPAAFTTRYEYNQTGSNMGECVSGAGDVNGDGVSDFLIGMKLYTGGGGALLYNGGPSNVASTASLTRASGLLGARMGSAIADAGDVNGDGFSDALVGAPEASNGQAGEGLVYLHYGSAAGLAPLPSLTLKRMWPVPGSAHRWRALAM